MTRTLMPFALALALLLPGAPLGAAETWTGVPLVDTLCATKVKDAPDAHTRECAVQCAKGGYGVIAADGTYLALDAAGNERALKALEASTKSDHLRVTLTGTRHGDTIAVESLTLQ